MREAEVLEQRGIGTKEIVSIGIFTALTFLCTMIHVKLPFGQGGLIHLGNIPMFLGAILFGKRAGAIIGGVGMAMFDLFSGWGAWAPFTLIVVGLMGFCTGWLTEKKKGTLQIVVAIFVALCIKIVGYYITEVILYHNFIAPVMSIPGNIMQVGVAGIVVLVMITPLKKVIQVV